MWEWMPSYEWVLLGIWCIPWVPVILWCQWWVTRDLDRIRKETECRHQSPVQAGRIFRQRS